MFGIARSSMREVIKTLHYLGVLESQTGRGTFVCERAKISTEALTWAILLGKNDIFEMVQLREVLEQTGIHAIMERSRSDPSRLAGVIEDLEREIENMKVAVEAHDVEALIKADYDFHGALIKGSDNSLFTAIYQTLRAFMHEEIKKTYQGTNIGKSVTEHTEFVNTLKSGDEASVRETHRNHIRSITDKLKSGMTA